MSIGRRHRRLIGTVAAVLLVAAAAGVYLFEPWKLFTSTTVDEALPTAPAAAAPASPAPNAPSSAPSAPLELARGGFASGEHPTTGTARLLKLPDASTVLRLEDLATSEGPDVRVYLSTLPAERSKLDDLGPGAVELAPLKGNRGNQNYTVPSGTDLSGVHSAVIWCKRFSVGFGAADLATT
ncbi:DM13 domain-containing protein [Kitasatospora camelliae]|uniref:DM13 domain-containing protein n=1 Tax=Kitasatospora camelliae TaxID=3156397 RepID=A0AAU8K1R4_9ACTN